MTKILLIDNYDSFVYNIAQYLGEIGATINVERNDSDSISDYVDQVDGFVISPGPGHPKNTRRSLEIIENDGFGRPVLGICLGHQAIAHVHGGSIIRADEVVHGKVHSILHGDDPLFDGVPSPFSATRYHSLLVNRDDLPSCLEISAETERGEIMGLRLKNREVLGLQFHPESVMTSHGKRILSNFLEVCKR